MAELLVTAMAELYSPEAIRATTIAQFQAEFAAAGDDIPKLVSLQNRLRIAMVEASKPPPPLPQPSPSPLLYSVPPPSPYSTPTGAMVMGPTPPLLPTPSFATFAIRRMHLSGLLKQVTARLGPLQAAAAEARAVAAEVEKLKRQQLELIQTQHRLQQELQAEAIAEQERQEAIAVEDVRRQRIVAEGGFVGRGAPIATPSGSVRPVVSDRILKEIATHRQVQAGKAKTSLIVALILVVAAFLLWRRK